MNRQQLYLCGGFLLAMAALSACASAPTAETQRKIDSGAQIACVSMQAADALFKSCAATPTFPHHDFCVAKADDEAKVYAGIRAACTPPYTLEPAVLITKAMQAVQDIQALSVPAPGS